MIGQPSLILFCYGQFGIAAVRTVRALGCYVSTIVIPSNRQGMDIDMIVTFAEQNGLHIAVQPPRKRIQDFAQKIRTLAPDLILVWSYSMILPPEIISIPKLGCVNVHGGLLPEYRGAHVMGWAIINGEKESGVTLHRIDDGIDTGPIIGRKQFPIERMDDAVDVRDKLRKAGIEALREWLPLICDGTAEAKMQNKRKAKYWRLRKPEDGLIDWNQSSAHIYNLIRALVKPWHGAFSFLNGERITIWRASTIDNLFTIKEAGTICRIEKKYAIVAAGIGGIRLEEAETPRGSYIHRLKVSDLVVGDKFQTHQT